MKKKRLPHASVEFDDLEDECETLKREKAELLDALFVRYDDCACHWAPYGVCRSCKAAEPLLRKHGWLP